MSFLEFQKKFKSSFGLVDTTGSTTTTSPYVSMAKAHHATVIFIAGTIAGDLTCTLRQGTTVGDPAGVEKVISGKSVTIDGGTGDNSIAILEVEASELDLVNGYMSVAGRVLAAAAAEVMVVVILGPTRFKPLA